jgi:hypothetical protein
METPALLTWSLGVVEQEMSRMQTHNPESIPLARIYLLSFRIPVWQPRWVSQIQSGNEYENLYRLTTNPGQDSKPLHKDQRMPDMRHMTKLY